ncbi:MAG: MFS transporter [Maricaulaceae bacterium]|jgi:POT family proton-dependent oligopeptide transporter
MNIVIVIGILVTLVTCVPVFTQMRKHPQGLHILFFAEMWERFSYYGMRGLLIFYLTQHFLFDDRFAQSQYGAYTSLVFLMPLLGGFLADKYIGTRKAIAFGALLLVAGHFLMGAEGSPATQSLEYNGERYEFVVEGRGNNRQVSLAVGDENYDFSATNDGGLQIEGLPAGSSLPSVLQAGTYELLEPERDSVFVGIFYLALSLIIMGVGFLKANISSIVGQLYQQGDPRRDPGFTLYYYGINLGAFWASILCGYLGQTVGWWAGFGLAGVGMALGWFVFMRRRLLFFTAGPAQLPDDVGLPPDPQALRTPVLAGLNREQLIYIGGLVGVGIIWFLVQSPPAAILNALNSMMAVFGGGESESQAHAHIGLALGVGSVVILGYLAFFMARECTVVETQRMIFALILIGVSVLFWTLFEQAGSSLNQFADRNTQLPNSGFFTVTASQVQSFNAGFILIFAPVFSAIWAFLGSRSLDPNPALKFALALVQVGLGFWVLVWGAQFADENYRVPLVFLGLLYLLHTTGELCLSPVGLSMVTKLSVARVVSTMMAVWFLSSAWAQFLAGLLAQRTATDTVAGQVLDPAAALETSVGVFKEIGLWAIVLGAGLGAVSFVLKRLAHEDKGVLSDAGKTAHIQPDPASPHPARPAEGDV